YIRIFYKNQRYLYFRYRKFLKRSKNEYALSTEISFEADLHYEVAKLSALNLARVEVSLKEVVDALENENFEQLLWRIYFSEVFGAKVVNVEIEKPKNYYLFDRGNLTLTFSDEYIFFNSGKKPLKRFESFYGYTRNIFTGENYIQVYKKKNQTLENDKLKENKKIKEKKENDFGNAQIILKSIRKPFSHIDNHIFYKVSEYLVKEMSQKVKETHLKFLMNRKV
uniref:hypothetical protein n=1 Tax=uncultured Veillonella sp. TaxID=159268 RepID=UPI0025FC36EE